MSVALFAPDWQSDSCQQEIKMVGVKKSCQVPVLLLLVTSSGQQQQLSQVTQQSRLTTALFILDTAHLGAFLKGRPLWMSTCEFHGGRKHVKGGEKEGKMKALGFLSRSASAKTCQPRQKRRWMGGGGAGKLRLPSTRSWILIRKLMQRRPKELNTNLRIATQVKPRFNKGAIFHHYQFGNMFACSPKGFPWTLGELLSRLQRRCPHFVKSSHF